jgi:2'-5' RNA ligase
VSRAKIILRILWEQHSYATLQITFPTEISKKIRFIREQIPSSQINTEEDEDLDPHVTIFYGLQNEDLELLRGELRSFGPIEYTIPGHLALFRFGEYKVLHLPIESKSLRRLHEKVKRVTGKEPPTFKEYKPHATVAYLKNNSSTKFDVPFQNLSGRADYVDFYTKNDNRFQLSLR